MYCGDGQGAGDSSTMHVTESPSISCSIQFTFQFGLKREHIQLSRSNFSLEELKELAATTVIKQFPQAQVYGNLSQKINLFLHNDQFDNILQLINNQSSNEVQDRSIIEIVLSADFNEASRKIQPHVLNVHSYRSPAFCDHCGEMLFGIVRQGLRCEGCGQNYHKRCAYKIPNNCTMERKRKASCSTPGPSGHSSNGSLCPVDSISSSGPILPSPVGKKPSRGPGRPLWAEGFTNIRVPHTFQVHSYTRPTVCHYCRRLLRGIFKQGMQCKDCKFSCHKRCMVEIPDNCPGEINDSKTSEADGEDLEMESDDSNETEAVFDNTKSYSPSPHQQARGGAVLSSSSSMLGPDPSHLPPPPSPAVPNGKNNGLLQVPSHEFEDPDMDIDPPRHAVSTSGVGTSELVPPHHHHHHHHRHQSSSAAVSSGGGGGATASGGGSGGQFEAPNIPLMRIAESFRNTKQHASSTILREGWLLHFTSNDALSRRHYWRLDSKSITLYRSNHGTNYHREVPLCDVLNIEVVQRMEEGKSVYATFLKINTSNADIFVCAEKEAKPGTLSQWHDAIKRALKPVDTIEQRPTSTVGGLKRKVSVMISFHHEKEDEKASDISEIYQVFPDEVLGSGQFGIVYGGKHRKRGFDVAVKVVEKQRFQHKEESQLRHEVQILESLDNPGIVRLYNMFETPEQIFVVMEKLRGDMLEMILSSEKGRLPERMTKFLITQILMALRYLHKQNVVHCDLKPENVLLSTPDAFPQLKLCDFGFARIIGQKSFRRSVVGTPAYLAPEVLRKECYNRSLDMWSVGVIIYVSLSGTFPFNEDEDINQQIQNAAFMYPPNPWNGISAEAIDLIGTLLQVKKRKRPSVDKALCHGWLHDFTCWKDLRTLEESLGKRYLTYESDDAHWQSYAIKQHHHDNKSTR